MSNSLRSPVVRTVVNSIQRLYPSAIADKTWDNTGLLLESPHRSDLVASRPKKHVVLLTIDLTRSVVDEAIALRSSMIITYHPIIFRPMKSLTFADSQQESLLRLAQEGISVYSPHTAVDATIGGVNDWLAEGISGGEANEESREVIEKVNGPEGFEDSGMGRIVVLKEGTELGELVKRVKAHLGMKKLMVADGTAGRKIKKLALCAGSGGSMFKNLNVDLFFTGELSHHEALAAKEKGISVISCFHTNTERGFLSAVMKPKLADVLMEEWKKVAETETEGKEGFEVVVSKNDRDPYDII
ncbi:Similar to Protein NIF3 homolog; acc. no. O94404 [Pyronema omphalodes CBS 100304]|uniref:Similar to Protein NIF3 homolog acc. no. O94404 n=1 Tax=Pyronema omphalodes (strain CBS 100304) TaxID=1076935 RepID=U4LR86_PYROM|nr:Similar to Protein NIF3 homolog; acc. no. O94404 [Pyronema omphalodes CBS 100304]